MDEQVGGRLKARRAEVNPIAWRYAGLMLSSLGALASIRAGAQLGAIPVDVAEAEKRKLHAVLDGIEAQVGREVGVLGAGRSCQRETEGSPWNARQ